MPRILLTIAALLTAIVVAAGCGSDGSSSSDGASLAPSGAVIYGEFTLDPEGDQAQAINSIIEKFPGEGSAGERIRGLFEKAFAESGTGLSYKDDIEPWLGDDAAFFVASLTPTGDGSGAFMVATDDEDASREAIEKAAKKDGKAASYKEHDYWTFSDGAVGVLDGWVVLGTEGGFKAAVDTAEGGSPITDDQAYEDALADAAEDRLGFVYFNAPAFADQLQKGAPGSFGPFAEVFKDPVLATITVSEQGLRLEANLPKSVAEAFPFIGEGKSTADLPADAWLAFAQPDLGATLDQLVGTLGGVTGGRDMIEQQLESATGLNLERDVLSWMGDWSVFVRGTSVPELGGALVIETSDEAASKRFIDAIARLASQGLEGEGKIGPLTIPGEGVTLTSSEIPEPVHLFQRDGKVVLAYGDAAAEDAIEPGDRLGDTQGYKDAQEALGGDYDLSIFVSFPQIVSLVDSLAGDSEGWLEVKPYLEPLGALVVGAREDGDKLRSAFGLTVR
jgi:hypothetical protein